MAIEVKRAGLLTTIQDLGRYSFQKYGVVVSGAMDEFSFKLANILVGNDLNDAALEITLLGPDLLFHKDAVIAISGASFQLTIDNIAVPLWRPIYVQKGSILKFGGCKEGCRAYLAIQGGIQTNLALNSRSTYIRGKLGGLRGEKLVAGDKIPVNEVSVEKNRNRFLVKRHESFSTTSWFLKTPTILNSSVIRALDGRQCNLFTEESKSIFFGSKYKISVDADRMGYRLIGKQLQLKKKVEMISEGTDFGTVQVPADGQPIVLMADRQTTGGYPKIAHIISVDLPLFAQGKPGDEFQFQKITLQEAQRLFLQREFLLKRISRVINNIYD